MKKKSTVLVVTGTRAEYGILRGTIEAIRAHPALSLRLLVTGMHTLHSRGLTKNDIKRDGYPINALVPIREGDDMLQALTQEINGIRSYCLRVRPDSIVVLGDRDESLAAALVAAHLGIPLAHIHGGDRTGPGVDESIRHAITKFAHIHFPATKKSAERIRALGEESWRVSVVGVPGLDTENGTARMTRKKIASALGLNKTAPWLIALHHPTQFDTEPLVIQIKSLLRALRHFPHHEKILLYPNNDTGSPLFIKELQRLREAHYHQFPSLPRSLYISALRESEFIVGNSSSGIIEAPFLGTPTVDIGNRQMGRERGRSVISAPYEERVIVRAAERAVILKRRQGGKPFSSPYGKGGAGRRTVKRLVTLLRHPRLMEKREPGN